MSVIYLRPEQKIIKRGNMPLIHLSGYSEYWYHQNANSVVVELFTLILSKFSLPAGKYEVSNTDRHYDIFLLLTESLKGEEFFFVMTASLPFIYSSRLARRMHCRGRFLIVSNRLLPGWKDERIHNDEWMSSELTEDWLFFSEITTAAHHPALK